MFPGAGATIYRNEAGEPIGWDYPSDEPPGYDDLEDDFAVLPICEVCDNEYEEETCEYCAECRHCGATAAAVDDDDDEEPVEVTGGLCVACAKLGLR